MTDSMVERVARALAERKYALAMPGDSRHPFDRIDATSRAILRDDARAAIAAMPGPDRDLEERWLIEQIESIRRDYEKAAAPFVQALIRIRAVRIPRIFVPFETSGRVEVPRDLKP